MWLAVAVLRDFRADDQTAVRELILDGLRERWGRAYDEAFNPDLDDIDANYVTRGADVVVVERDGELVATGMLLPGGTAQARIVRMSVCESHRRKGLGRQVVEELVARARRRGLREVMVSTDTPWLSAVALYTSCGFEETGRDNTDTHFSMAL